MCSCPSRTDEPYDGEGHNQSPNALSADLTTNEDLNGIANTREHRGLAGTITSADLDDGGGMTTTTPPDPDNNKGGGMSANGIKTPIGRLEEGGGGGDASSDTVKLRGGSTSDPSYSGAGNPPDPSTTRLDRLKRTLYTFAQFVGPGFMIAVAYIDPGNYATDIAAGASYRFKLLFIVLLSNLFAILLQSLAIKLGTVTGLDLASACRAFLPRWLNYFLYALAEIAIIATDIAEVHEATPERG